MEDINVTVGEFIKELSKLPKELNIIVSDYDNQYELTPDSIRWDITLEEYKEGYTDQPYIWLTK